MDYLKCVEKLVRNFKDESRLYTFLLFEILVQILFIFRQYYVASDLCGNFGSKVKIWNEDHTIVNYAWNEFFLVMIILNKFLYFSQDTDFFDKLFVILAKLNYDLRIVRKINRLIYLAIRSLIDLVQD